MKACIAYKVASLLTNLVSLGFQPIDLTKKSISDRLGELDINSVVYSCASRLFPVALPKHIVMNGFSKRSLARTYLPKLIEHWGEYLPRSQVLEYQGTLHAA